MTGFPKLSLIRTIIVFVCSTKSYLFFAVAVYFTSKCILMSRKDLFKNLLSEEHIYIHVDIKSTFILSFRIHNFEETLFTDLIIDTRV